MLSSNIATLSGGVGFRAIVRPNVVGLVDIAFGEEGSAVYVGIDYPVIARTLSLQVAQSF